MNTRLQQLQSFQIKATKKAMSFPNVHTVVYSTCSIHQEEDECVVSHILNWCKEQTADDGTNCHQDLKMMYDWEVKVPPRFLSWHRRGYSPIDNNHQLSAEQQNCLIRCLPEDGMIGFFVALYVNSSKKERCTDEQIVLLRNQKNETITSNDQSMQSESPVVRSATKKTPDATRKETHTINKVSSKVSGEKKSKSIEPHSNGAFLCNMWKPRGMKRKR